MGKDRYKGWTNWDTWAAHLWLRDQGEGYYDLAVDAATPGNPEWAIRQALIGLLQDMGNPDDIDFTRVNWTEVIEALREEAYFGQD